MHFESPEVVDVGGSAEKIDHIEHDAQQKEVVGNFVVMPDAPACECAVVLPVLNADSAGFAMLLYHQLLLPFNVLLAVRAPQLLIPWFGNYARVHQSCGDPHQIQVNQDDHVDSWEDIGLLVLTQHHQHHRRHNVYYQHGSYAHDFCVIPQVLLGPSTKNGSSLRIPQSFMYYPIKLSFCIQAYFYI